MFQYIKLNSIIGEVLVLIFFRYLFPTKLNYDFENLDVK